MSLVEIKNFSLSFGRHKVVKDAYMTIKKGELVALVGESGSGKSVTALSILQLVNGGKAEGSIKFDGVDVLQDKTALQEIRGRKVGVIFQEPMTSLNPLHTIGKQMAESIMLHNPLIKRPALINRINELLDNVGLSGLKTRLKAFPHELSGGQRQRIMIAMAIANNPELLIADEPTTALDVVVAAQILKLLKQIQKKHKMAILLITHDLTIVKNLSNRLYVMKGGEMVESGKTSSIFEYPKHAYTKKLIHSAPEGLAVRVPSHGDIVTAKDFSVKFPIKGGFFGRTIDNFKAVDNISIKIPEGKTMGIVGESGSGKTTLALGLMRLIRSEGQVVFAGKHIEGLSPKQMRELRADMQIVFQDPYASLNPRMTIEQIIGEGLRAHNLNADIGAILEEVGLSRDMAERFPHEFSGGQRQRIGIARAIALNPKFILLDEPTSALDLTVQSQIIDLLKKLQRERHITYIFITHDLRVMRAIAHDILVMKNGQIVEQGHTRQIFTNPKNAYTKQLIEAALMEI